MFGLQATDILIIAIVALIFFGPSRLPEIARGIGKGMREFQGAVKGESARPQEDTKTITSGTTEAPKPVQDPPSEQ